MAQPGSPRLASLLLLSWILIPTAADTVQQITVSVPTGLSLIGNPFTTNLLIRSLIPNPSEGLAVYTFDYPQQTYHSDQFSFGHWTSPDQTLAAGRGAWIYNPGPAFDLAMAGSANTNPPVIGANLDLI